MKLKHIIVITTAFPNSQEGRESASSFFDFVQTQHRYTSMAVVAPSVA